MKHLPEYYPMTTQSHVKIMASGVNPGTVTLHIITSDDERTVVTMTPAQASALREMLSDAIVEASL
jgi:hypothetical protein